MSLRNIRRTRKAKIESDSGDCNGNRSDEDEEEYEEVKPKKERIFWEKDKNTSSDSENVPLSRRRRKKQAKFLNSRARGRVNHSTDEEVSDQNESDEESEETDSPPHKRQKTNSRKVLPKKNKSKAGGRKLEVEDDPSDSSETRGMASILGARKRKRKRKAIVDTSDRDFVSQAGYEKKSPRNERLTTGRVRSKVKYTDDLSDSEFENIVRMNKDDEEEEKEEEEVDIDFIDRVLDHREGKVGATGELTKHLTVKERGDPNLTLETDQLETQYFIKWKDKAHINNTWETEQTLDAMKVGEVKVKGLIKVNKYQNRVSDYKSWKKKANPEDVEFHEIDIELGKELLKTHVEIERIFCKRKNDENEVEFFVKWRNLPYSDATWENEKIIKSCYREDYEMFKRRKKANADPRDYRSSMKGAKVKFTPMKEQPDYIGSESYRLRDYQLDGISFLLNAWCKGNSVILADEMGLGKTIQTICFLKYLFHNYSFKGPMLVCVPLSTVAAWQKEFAQWAPDMNTVTYLGDSRSRDIIREFECENEQGELSFNVLLASYEMVCRDKTFFQDLIWSNIVVDEAHRLKNEDSLLYKVLNEVDSHHRLLLTGTPLQNNLKELWCLLNYLKLSDIEDWPTFEQQFGKPEDVANGYIGLHSLLKPYIIRRLKKDVEKSLPPKVEQILRVEMTRKQKNMYKMVLTKNYHFLSKGGKSQVSLINIMMQLRKTTNHVELIHDADPEEEKTAEERLKDLNNGSGKMLLLDKLLTRFRETGDRVLIFSQMVIMLNIIEEYLRLRRFPYQRLDGSINSEKRKQAIRSFNAPDSSDFCFLLSTKAGGLGINLQTANRVIIYDSDFNPQNDLQAIARAHRIGQKEEVKIFRLVASSSVDEDIIQKAKNKMVLDHLVIQNMDTTGKTVINGKKNKTAALSKDELNTIIKFGAADLFKETEEGGEDGEEVDLDAILSNAETREEVEAPISEANKELLSAFKCTNLRLEEEEVMEESGQKNGESAAWEDIIPEELRSQYKPRQEFDGLELVSDNDDLYSSIADRRKKRNKNKKKNVLTTSDFEDEDEGSDYNVGDSEPESEESDQEALTEEDKRIREFLRKSQALKNNPVSTFKCLEDGCGKNYAEKRNLKRHMMDKHKLENFEPTVENFHNLAEVQSSELICQLCRRQFKEIEYKIHINLHHGGSEPEINYNSDLLREFRRYQAKLKILNNEAKSGNKNVICVECGKCFSEVQYLRNHMTLVHTASLTEWEVTEENFLHLPSIKSPILRCFSCNLSMIKPLAYKIHLVNKHKSGMKKNI